MPKQVRKWHELSLICGIGAGVAAVAPPVCRLLRELVGADAASLFWMNDQGLPEGFFHEDSPESARELFVNEFGRLFVGANELNVATLARMRGRPGGHLLAPGANYFRSNTFNLLVRPSGHRHALDLRIDIGGRARAIVLLFRASRTFDEDDLAVLSVASGRIALALADRSTDDDWRPYGSVGHLLVDADGGSVTMATAVADQLLRASNLVGEGLRLTGPLRTPPAFVADLARLATAGLTAERAVPVPGGRLRATAEAMRAPDAAGAAVLVTLAPETPRHLARVEGVLALGLSPRRRDIALAASRGATRAEAAAELGLGEEAMKKHLAAIYAAAGAHSWDELARALA